MAHKSGLIDITGIRFGRLVVMERATKKVSKSNKKAYWLCRCDCGKQVVVVGSSLRNGQTLLS